MSLELKTDLASILELSPTQPTQQNVPRFEFLRSACDREERLSSLQHRSTGA